MIATIATAVAVFCLAIAQYFNLKIMKAQSARIKALEHFIYPEWDEERGWKIKTEPYDVVQ